VGVFWVICVECVLDVRAGFFESEIVVWKKGRRAELVAERGERGVLSEKMALVVSVFGWNGRRVEF
jgi:hypothetical protein